MVVAAIALHLIVGFGPEGVADRFIGIFLKTLAQEFGAGFTPRDEKHLPGGVIDRLAVMNNLIRHTFTPSNLTINLIRPGIRHHAALCHSLKGFFFDT